MLQIIICSTFSEQAGAAQMGAGSVITHDSGCPYWPNLQTHGDVDLMRVR